MIETVKTLVETLAMTRQELEDTSHSELAELCSALITEIKFIHANATDAQSKVEQQVRQLNQVIASVTRDLEAARLQQDIQNKETLRQVRSVTRKLTLRERLSGTFDPDRAG